MNSNASNNGVPVPPGGKVIEVEVVNPPKTEEPGALGKIWAWIRELPGRVSSGVHDALSWAYNKVAQGLGAINAWVVEPVFSRIERWIPFTGQIREIMPWYGLGLLLVGAVVGALVAGQAGMGILGTFGMMAYGIALIPWIIVTTPSLWLSILTDLWILSSLCIVFEAGACWIEGRGFFKPLLQLSFPGWYDLVANWKKEEAQAAPACA